MKKSKINFLAALAVFLAVPMLSSCLCAKYGPESKACKIQELALDCTSSGLKDLGIEYAPAIKAILMADISQAKKFAQLDGLLNVGKDALMCAIANMPILFSQQAASMGTVIDTPEKQKSYKLMQTAKADALAYLGRYKVKAKLIDNAR
jgi:hypothetical protein